MHETINEIYSNSEYKNIIHNIDGLGIPFDPVWKSIGISVSGGADSASLAYHLCTLIEKTSANTVVHIISHVRMWKTRPWQRYNSIDVFEWLINRFPKIKFIRHENFIPPDLEYGNKGPNIEDEYGNVKSGDQIIVRAHAEWIAFKEDLNAWFSAKSKNPSNVEMTKAMPDRYVKDPSIEKLILNHNGVLACHPYLFTEKDWIIKQYVDNDILSLLEITRSCEGEIKGIDYKTYTPGWPVPTCGECFWCQERNWAMEKNNVR